MANGKREALTGRGANFIFNKIKGRRSSTVKDEALTFAPRTVRPGATAEGYYAGEKRTSVDAQRTTKHEGIGSTRLIFAA